MVAASKLRRAQAAAEAARPYAERMDKVLGNIAASVAGLDTAPRAAARHRQRPGASAARLHRRARPVRRVQLGDRAARARARQRADRPRARRSSSSASAARATSSCAATTRSRSSSWSSCAACARSASSNAEAIAEKIIALLREGRVRRLHAVLLALQVGDRADPDRAADHSAGVRGRGRGRPRRRRPTNTSRRKTTSSPSCCRATSRCRSSARCWRTPPRSTARR